MNRAAFTNETLPSSSPRFLASTVASGGLAAGLFRHSAEVALLGRRCRAATQFNPSI